MGPLRLLATQFPAVSMVVTTRPSAVRGLPPIDGFCVANLLSMDNEQIAAYVHNWFVVASSNGEDLLDMGLRFATLLPSARTSRGWPVAPLCAPCCAC